MKWNEYTNTCSKAPERFDVSRMKLTKLRIINIIDGKVEYTNTDINKERHD